MRLLGRAAGIAFSILLLIFTLPSGCGQEPTPEQQQIALVFVHGAASSPARFEWLADKLGDVGWDNQYMFSYDCRDAGIEEVAADLSDFIEEEVEPQPGRRLVLIGHSLGGVISRYWVERMGGHKATLAVILLGVPNRGSASADALREMYRSDFLQTALYDGLPLNQGQSFLLGRLIRALHREMGDKSILQICTDSPLISSLNHKLLPDGVLYFTVAGTTEGGPFLTAYQLLSRLRKHLGYHLDRPNDGLVSVVESTIPEKLGVSGKANVQANHMDMLKHGDTGKAVIGFLEQMLELR
jgi:pimeloyl-ACP methyl ester carboxylesterase